MFQIGVKYFILKALYKKINFYFMGKQEHNPQVHNAEPVHELVHFSPVWRAAHKSTSTEPAGEHSGNPMLNGH